MRMTPRLAKEYRIFPKGEGFDQTFSKVCAVEAAEASSPSAEGEIPSSAFLFVNFFFAPFSCKEKVEYRLLFFDELLFYQIS